MSGYHCTRYTVGQLSDERSELGKGKDMFRDFFFSENDSQNWQHKPLFASQFK